MLDLHEESGIAAILACGLYGEFRGLTGDCEESMVVADEHGNIVHVDKGERASRPEIARHNIMKLLLTILPESSIISGSKIVSATRDTGTGKVTLELESTVERGTTTSAIFDHVVGANIERGIV